MFLPFPKRVTCALHNDCPEKQKMRLIDFWANDSHFGHVTQFQTVFQPASAEEGLNFVQAAMGIFALCFYRQNDRLLPECWEINFVCRNW